MLRIVIITVYQRLSNETHGQHMSSRTSVDTME